MRARPAREAAPVDEVKRNQLWILSAFLFVVGLVAVFVTETDYGVASDVPNYFASSIRQLAWLKKLVLSLLGGGSTMEVLSHESVLEHWRWMPFRIPHPPLSREISGITWLLFRDSFDTITAYRVGVMLAYAALVAGCASFTAVAGKSLLAGVGAGLSILTIPVLFAHGHLAHTDLFLTTFWFGAAAHAYLWTDGRDRRHLFGSGLLLGAALATKFSGLLAIPALCCWIILKRPREAASAIAILLLTAAFVLFATNPVFWVDPALAISDYLGAGLDRADDIRSMIRTEYFSRIYVYRAAWHYPFVWTLIVLPPTLIVAIAAAFFDRDRRWVTGFSLLNIAPLYAALMLPTAPMHDGPRLVLPAFAFFAVLAGIGFRFIAARARRLSTRRSEAGAPWLAVIVGIMLFAPAAGAVIRTHPYQLSYANLLIGGTRGVEAKGLEVTNLKEVLNDEALRDMAALIPEGATIDAGFFLEEMCFYRFLEKIPRSWALEASWLNPDRTEVGQTLVCTMSPVPEIVAEDRIPSDAEYLLVLNRKAMWRPVEWALYEGQEDPIYRVSLEGVPLLSVYRFR